MKQKCSITLATAQQGKSDNPDGVKSAETNSFCWQIIKEFPLKKVDDQGILQELRSEK